MAGAGISCLKMSVLLVAVLCVTCSLGLIAVGSYVMVKFNEYGPGVQKTWQAAPIAVISIGVFVFLVSFIGCYGAMKENYYLLYTYGVFLVIILIAELVAAILAIVYKDQVKTHLQEVFKKAIGDYGKVDEVTKAVDAIQETFKCCGAQSSTDYSPGQIPRSCSIEFYDTGCVTKLEPYMQKQLIIIAVIMFVIIFIELIVITFTFLLAKHFRSYEQV